jgi:hypothetical protein
VAAAYDAASAAALCSAADSVVRCHPASGGQACGGEGTCGLLGSAGSLPASRLAATWAAVACYWASVLGAYLSRTKRRGRVWLPDAVPGAGWWWLVVVGDLGRPRAHV